MQKQLEVEEFLSNHKLVLADKIKRGPFISNYGIKLHDPVFQYESNIVKMRSLTSKLTSGKRVKIKNADDKRAEGKDTPDDLTKSIDVS